MNKSLLALSIIVLFLASCGMGGVNKTTLSLADYNEKLVKPFNAFSEKMQKEREEIYAHKHSAAENKALIVGLSASLDSCITFTNGLEYPAAGADLHSIVLKLYGFERDSLMPLLSKVAVLNPDAPEWGGNWEEFDLRNKRVDEMLATMESTQTAMQAKYK